MDREALVRIFDLYSTSLYNYALRLCQDPLTADHIVGDVFAKFLEQLSMGRGPETHLRSYLYQMTYHLVVDDARYSSRRTSLEALDLYFHEEAAFLSAEKRLTYETVLHAIRTCLTEIQRHVIILRFLEGMNLKETARIVGKREEHVKVIQSRALKALRKALHAVLK
jgi:RNA polymerase sigma-70 factor, ECF subfamily